ncbi:hypothetical protein Btru_062430 [Bulinus truncatus]|nr:hypothetical protein Btru_062430 [Bulinus truncatus]
MVSLIDQDLSLMKQLLTLNETIEELKWQRQYYSCSTSCASLSNSKNLDSNWSVSDTEMYEAEDDLMAVNHVTCGVSQAGTVTGPTWHSTRKARKATKDLDNALSDTVPDIADRSGNTQRHHHGSDEDFPNDVTVCSRPLDSVGHLKYNYIGQNHLDSIGQSLIHHDREQNSFDSGIHDDVVWTV